MESVRFGAVLSFVFLASAAVSAHGEDATEAWKKWYRENASAWDQVEDIEAEFAID